MLGVEEIRTAFAAELLLTTWLPLVTGALPRPAKGAGWLLNRRAGLTLDCLAPVLRAEGAGGGV
ncbi:MAG TPA: hypothetical protein VIV60_30660 [Polyangiaceae bacterium]